MIELFENIKYSLDLKDPIQVKIKEFYTYFKSQPKEIQAAINAALRKGMSYKNAIAAAKKTEEGTMSNAEKHKGGPKFTGYYKGTDKGRPGNKMVGSD